MEGGRKIYPMNYDKAIVEWMDGWIRNIYIHELSKAGAGGQGKEYIPMN